MIIFFNMVSKATKSLDWVKLSLTRDHWEVKDLICTTVPDSKYNVHGTMAILGRMHTVQG